MTNPNIGNKIRLVHTENKITKLEKSATGSHLALFENVNEFEVI